MASPAPAALSLSPPVAPVLECRAVSVAAGNRQLVRGLDFRADEGQFIAVLGRNGVGKTLTLHTLAGLRAPASGAVWLDGTAISAWPARARARRLSLLPQVTDDPFPSTVFDAALIGRHPHLPFWQWEDADDLARARRALALVGLEDLGARSVESLSGGERRRLDVATLLAQEAAVCLLDEPINHLDPRHRGEVMALFRALADRGGIVVATLHDATQAARYADRVLLLFGDGRWRYGETHGLLSGAALSELYEVPVTELAWRGERVFVSA